ncbi:MAG: Crp/Fnr family transcriptional regulator [Hyphomonadaceae bacterium]
MNTPRPRKSDDLPGAGPKRPEDLRLLRIFKDVEAELLEGAFAALQPQRVKAHATLRLDRDFKDRVGFVWSGAYRFCAATPAGETITLYAVRPPHAFGFAMAIDGLGFGDVHRLAVDRGGVLLALPVSHFNHLAATSPAFARNLNRALAHLTLIYGARVYEFASASVRVRLQSELLRQAERAPAETDRRPLMPSPTHAKLADLVGASREAVTRHLQTLAEEGLIDVRRGQITVTSVAALRDLDRRALGRRFRRRKDS